MLDDNNLKTLFLLGKDYNFANICKLKSLKIIDICEIGFDKYNEYISSLCITKDDIDELFNYELDKELEPFIFIVSNCLHGHKDFKENILCALSFFLGEPVYLCKEGFFYLGEIIDERFITHKNFNFFIEILKMQNCIEIKKRAKPKNEAQKKFFVKLKKAREKYKKKDDGIHHIISAVCAKHSSYNLFNVEDLTMFQLIDQYKRMHAIDDYFITINSMMHGASGEGVKLKHWSESIE